MAISSADGPVGWDDAHAHKTNPVTSKAIEDFILSIIFGPLEDERIIHRFKFGYRPRGGVVV